MVYKEECKVKGKHEPIRDGALILIRTKLSVNLCGTLETIN